MERDIKRWCDNNLGNNVILTLHSQEIFKGIIEDIDDEYVSLSNAGMSNDIIVLAEIKIMEIENG